MNRNVLIVIIVAVLLVASGGAYLLITQDDGGEEKTYDVRVGYLAGDLHQLARVVAMDDNVSGGENLYKQYGLNISSPSPYANGGFVMDGFAAGEIDIGFLGAPPAILKRLNVGTDIIVISKVNSEGSSIVVKSGIDNITDLVGKTVATPGVSSIQHLMFLEVLEENGLVAVQSGNPGGENVVFWTQIAPKDMKAALQTDTVDAAIGWEPYGSDSLLDGTAVLLDWSSEIWPDHPCCVVAVRKAFAEANPQTVIQFLKAHIAANELIAESMDQGSGEQYDRILELAMEFSNRNETVVLSSLQHMQLSYDMGGNFNSYLEDFTQSYIDLGLIPADKLDDAGYANVTVFVAAFVDDQYLVKALE
jgi:NitT/TauT family transport system substrate-binding protein